MIGVVFGLGLSIIGPLIIDKAYDSSSKIFFTSWESDAVLSYFGTILGATATIIAVTLTIYTTNKSAQLDRKNAIDINNKNVVLKSAFSLIDAMDYDLIGDLILNFILKSEYLDNHLKLADLKRTDVLVVRENLTMIQTKLKTEFVKYEMLVENKELTDLINDYVINFNTYIVDVAEILISLEEDLSKNQNVVLESRSSIMQDLTKKHLNFTKAFETDFDKATEQIKDYTNSL